MRRKDREMNREFGLELIDQADYGTLAMVDQKGEPYALPLSLVREGDTLYFHSAKAGRKTEVLKNSPEVCLSFVGEVRVPENFTEDGLQKIAEDEALAQLLLSKVFTTEFASTIVTGQAFLVTEESEKIKALRLICEKYTASKMDYFPLAIKVGLAKVDVYKITIETITAKMKQTSATP